MIPGPFDADLAARALRAARSIPTPRAQEDEVSTNGKYRKKPVVIEAVQFDGTKDSANEILAWIGSYGADAKRAHNTKPERGLSISTLEGDMTASPGDWVIRGVQDEFYPCKADIFAATYEPADGSR